MIFPSFSTHKHLTTSWHSWWKAFDKYFWDFLPFPLSLDELVLESLLQIFHILHLKSGLGSPAGTSHINPMMLPFPGRMGWRTHGSSEFVTGATSDPRSCIHAVSRQCPAAWGHQPGSWAYQRSAVPALPTHLLLLEILLYACDTLCLGIPWGCLGTQVSKGGNLPLALELPERESAGMDTPRRNSTARRREARKALC